MTFSYTLEACAACLPFEFSNLLGAFSHNRHNETLCSSSVCFECFGEGRVLAKNEPEIAF